MGRISNFFSLFSARPVVEPPVESVKKGLTVDNNSAKDDLRHELDTDQPGSWSTDHREESRQYTGNTYVAIESMATQCSQAVVKGVVYGPNRTDDDEGEPLAHDDDLLKFIREPNPGQTGNMFRYEQALQLKLTGTCLIWLVRNRFGKIVERYVIPTALATPQGYCQQYPNGSWRINPEGQRYGAMFTLGALRNVIGYDIPAEDMHVIRMPHPTRKDDGYSPVSATACWTDVSNAIDHSQNASMRNSMKPSALVTVNELANRDDFKATEARLNAKYAGSTKDGKIMLLEGDGVKVDILSTPAKEMDYNKSSVSARDRILSAYKTPPIAVGIESPSGRDGLYAPMKQYIHLAVQPLLDILATEDNRIFVWQYGKGYEISYTAREISDTAKDKKEEKAKELQMLIEAKALTKNALLECLGFDPMDDDRGEQLVGELDPEPEAPATQTPLNDKAPPNTVEPGEVVKSILGGIDSYLKNYRTVDAVSGLIDTAKSEVPVVPAGDDPFVESEDIGQSRTMADDLPEYRQSKSKADCGANGPGGTGFQAGNTCASGGASAAERHWQKEALNDPENSELYQSLEDDARNQRESFKERHAIAMLRKFEKQKDSLPKDVYEDGISKYTNDLAEARGESVAAEQSTFKPAKTTKEAESFAVDNGLAKKANYKKISVEYANEVNKSLLKFKDEYGEAFDEIKTAKRKTRESGQSWMTATDHYDKSGEYEKTVLTVNGGTAIFLRENHVAVNDQNGTDISPDDSEIEVMEKWIANSHKSRWTSSGTIEGSVAHEYGHLLTAERDGIQEAKKRQKDLRYKTDRSISRYAGTHGMETLAETFSLYATDPSKVTQAQKDFFNQHSKVKIK